ncbi:hypothetical protein Tco_0631129 [Tanacetum coccineum]
MSQPGDQCQSSLKSTAINVLRTELTRVKRLFQPWLFGMHQEKVVVGDDVYTVGDRIALQQSAGKESICRRAGVCVGVGDNPEEWNEKSLPDQPIRRWVKNRFAPKEGTRNVIKVELLGHYVVPILRSWRKNASQNRKSGRWKSKEKQAEILANVGHADQVMRRSHPVHERSTNLGSKVVPSEIG